MTNCIDEFIMCFAISIPIKELINDINHLFDFLYVSH